MEHAKKRNTKQRILEESMKLFSVQGFDAVSIRAIADAVGVGNSALYKHFSSKAEILSAIVAYSKDYFLEKGTNQMSQIACEDDLVASCMEMFRFHTEDEWMVMFRKLLTIEQFKNPEISAIYRDFYVELPIRMQEEQFQHLIDAGYLKPKHPKVLAMELNAPFLLFHTAPDTEGLAALLEQHVRYFWKENVICQ